MGPAPVDTVTAPRVAPDALGGQAGELPTPLAFAERSAPGALARLALPPPAGAPTAGASPRAWERAARSRFARSRSLALVSPGRTSDQETTHLQMDPASSASRLFPVCPPTQPKDRERKRAGRKGEKNKPNSVQPVRSLVYTETTAAAGAHTHLAPRARPRRQPRPAPVLTGQSRRRSPPTPPPPPAPGPRPRAPRGPGLQQRGCLGDLPRCGGRRSPARSVYRRWFGSRGRRALPPKCTCRRLFVQSCVCLCVFVYLCKYRPDLLYRLY